MGITFQPEPGAPPSRIIIHVRMWDKDNVLQQQALGVVGRPKEDDVVPRNDDVLELRHLMPEPIPLFQGQGILASLTVIADDQGGSRSYDLAGNRRSSE